jgi:hypothetical protein
MKKILLLILFPFFLFSQPIIEIGYDNNDSLKQVIIVPFLSSHYALDTNGDRNNTFFGYGGDLYFNFSSKFKVSSRILKLNDDLNSSISNYIDSLGVLPGMNQIDDNLTFFSLSANYKINKFFSTQFGKGKQFFGYGYRSMLLSNNHSAYPFLTFITEFWKVKYYNHFTTFSDIYNSDISQKKHGAFHYLDFQANKNLTFGLFEGIIWQSSDENYERGFDVHYLNPIIFYRPVEFSKHSPDNALMGLNIKYQLNKINIYGQLLIDDLNINRYENTGDGFFQNKLAYQLGLKSEFNFKKHELLFLTEFNQAQPYTYAHKHPMQNYTHMNQALAHPLGANFKENIIMLNHRYKKWATNFKYTYAIYGADSLGTHYGQNIFISDFEASGEGGEFSYGNYNGQGIKTQLHTFYAEVNYDLRVAKAFLACYIRNRTNQHTTSYVVVGIKTNFLNPFLDF